MEHRDTLPTLRASLDGNDTFLSGGHQVIKTAGGSRHAKRMEKVPVWALDDEKIKQYINTMFPKAKTNKEQRTRAAKIVRILYLYYRVGETRAGVAEQVGMTEKAVEMVLRRVNKVMSGPHMRPKGRPKKPESMETASEVNF